MHIDDLINEFKSSHDTNSNRFLLSKIVELNNNIESLRRECQTCNTEKALRKMKRTKKK